MENRRSLDRAFLRRHAALFGWFALPLAIWCVVAIPYYGTPVPNSFVGKFYQGRIRWWWHEVHTFRHQLLLHFLQWRYRALFILAAASGAVAIARGDRALRASALFCVLYLGAYSVTHVPAYGNYYFPLFAMMTVSALRAAVLLCGSLAARLPAWPWAPRVHAALAGAIAVAGAAVAWRHSTFAILSSPRADPSHQYVRIAGFLREQTPAAASDGAMEIGIIGYYSERRIVDFAGLASRGVARAVAAGDLRFALDRFHPDFVVARYPVPARLEGGLTEQELSRNYRWVFEAGGIGVFARAPPESGSAGRFLEQENTVFILQRPLDPAAIAAMNSKLASRGSALSVSWWRGDHEMRGKRFSYVGFKEVVRTRSGRCSSPRRWSCSRSPSASSSTSRRRSSAPGTTSRWASRRTPSSTSRSRAAIRISPSQGRPLRRGSTSG